MTTMTSPLIENLATAEPSEIDGHLARLGAEAATLRGRLDFLHSESNLLRAGKPCRGLRGYPSDLRIAEYSAEVAGRIEATHFRLAEVAHLMYPLEVEFDRRPWSRYYLVDDGHLHYDVSGDRCNRDLRTTHYWMTEFSGMPAKMVIGKAQDRVCTKCFPDARVVKRSPHPRFMTMTEAEKAAHAEDKARKAAAKKAAQITTPEGGELIVDGRQIKTERAAWNHAMSEATSLAWYGESHPSAGQWREDIRLCLAALAHRRGVDVHDLYTELNAKVAKKVKKDGGTFLSVA